MKKFNTTNPFDPFDYLANQTVGFDKFLDNLKAVSDTFPKQPVYPPYNIRKIDDNHYVIELAVAGFSTQEIDIEMDGSNLTIRGNSQVTDDESQFIHQGIAKRAFTRTFQVADTVEVKNADMINGMLKIWLERFIPEEQKPRKVPINSGLSKAELLNEKAKRDGE